MGNSTFTGAVRSKNGFKHVSVNATTGTETETTIVNSSGELVADLSGSAMTTAAGSGITDGTGAVVSSEITKSGKVIHTQIFIDITDLKSSTDDLDIIGTGLSAAYFAQILNAESGQVFAASMTCLEAPTTGVTDIDLYAATENTGVFDGGIAALAETAIVTSGGAWTLNKTATATGWPLNAKYLYLTCGAAGTIGTYDAGQFLIEFWGYEA